MAATFTVVGQEPGVQSIGNLKTQDVINVAINTIPSGIYVEFPVLTDGYSPGVVKAAAEGWADIAETLAAEPNVAGVQWTQEVNASNLLEPAWVITVSSTSGNSAAQITVLNRKLGPGLDRTAIDNLHAQLDATEQL